MTKPFIAIVANQCELVVGPIFHDHPLTYVPQFYIDAVQQAGGVPVVLPLTAPAAIAQSVAAFDGFLLTGGQGVSPFLYGEEPLPKLGMTLLQRDQFEIALVKAVVAAGKPLLGVCPGDAGVKRGLRWHAVAKLSLPPAPGTEAFAGPDTRYPT